MKSLIAALVILSSSIGFAQAAATPAQPALTPEEVQLFYFVGCSVEKFCVNEPKTAFDTDFLTFKADVEKQLGASCAQLEIDANLDAAKTELVAIASSVVASGETTCLSSIVAPAPALTVAP